MIYCDTSVLVASSIASHPYHGSSLAFLNYCQRHHTSISINTHVLAEFFNTMSRYPLEVSPDVGQLIELVESKIKKYFKIVVLTADDYISAMKNLHTLQLKGPIIYDALHYQSAQKLNAKTLVTWNQKDFLRLSTGDIEIATPESFIEGRRK